MIANRSGRVIERHEGIIVLRASRPFYRTALAVVARYTSAALPRLALWVLQCLAMMARTFLMIGTGVFFVAWILDTSHLLWLGCMFFLLLCVGLSSQVVLYIKHIRGVR